MTAPRAPRAPGAVEAARNWLEDARWELWVCRRCPGQDHDVEAAALAYDMAVAEHYAGRRPKLWSIEIAGA